MSFKTKTTIIKTISNEPKHVIHNICDPSLEEKQGPWAPIKAFGLGNEWRIMKIEIFGTFVFEIFEILKILKILRFLKFLKCLKFLRFLKCLAMLRLRNAKAK